MTCKFTVTLMNASTFYMRKHKGIWGLLAQSVLSLKNTRVGVVPGKEDGLRGGEKRHQYHISNASKC